MFARTFQPRWSKRVQVARYRTGAFAFFLGGCCAFADFGRDVVVTHSSGLEVGPLPSEAGGQEPTNANGIPLPRFALRAGDTATFRAQAEETYFGDGGCEAEGLLGPSSAQDPRVVSFGGTVGVDSVTILPAPS